MLPVKAVIASASFSSLLAVRASCSRRLRSVSMFLRSAELNSPPLALSSAICLDDIGNSAHERDTRFLLGPFGDTDAGQRCLFGRRGTILQIVVIEISKPGQRVPVVDFYPLRIPFQQPEMPEFLNDAVGVNAGNSAGVGNVHLGPRH